MHKDNLLQQQYEPYQRAEFLANFYAQGPKTQSGLTMGTAPSTSPLLKLLEQVSVRLILSR